MFVKGTPIATTDQFTIIGPGTVVSGNITAPHMIKMYGKVTGDIASDDAIAIGNSAEVQGNVSGRSVEIAGKVAGTVSAIDKVKLSETASLKGDIVCKKLVIEEGAIFEGNTSMSTESLQLHFPTERSKSSVTTPNPKL
ncbi:MAG: polymer-forming cytoskeletal protein [bacterium]|nr:polymer-forming cytoskeletal protein [bacterium]